jgi:hypothetical protein
VPEIFKTLREAVAEPDKAEASRLVEVFVRREWYKKHTGAGWHGSHKSAFDAYSGYWCFEAAAVVKIRGLDDSAFRDWKYYPKDLVF